MKSTINAYIEEEVQRRLRKMNLLNGSSSMDLSLSCESLREEEEASDCSSVRLTDEDDEKLQNINPRRLKYEKACGLWSGFLPALELEANSPLHIHENVFEEPNKSLLKLHREGKLESASEALIEKEEGSHAGGNKNKWWQGGVNIPLGELDRDVCELDRLDIGRHKFCVAVTNKFDENENITCKKRKDSDFCVPGDNDEKTEDRTKELLENGHSEEVQNQTYDSGVVEDSDLPNDQSSELQNSVNSYINSKQESKNSLYAQIKQETGTVAGKVAANGSYVLWYFAGKLSEVYKDAGRRLQDTRDIMQKVRTGEMKVAVSQYVTMMSKELPLIHRMQLKSEPEPCILAENKPSLAERPRMNSAELKPEQEPCILEENKDSLMEVRPIHPMQLKPKPEPCIFAENKAILQEQPLITSVEPKPEPEPCILAEGKASLAEQPLITSAELKPEPEPCTLVKNKQVSLADQSRDGTLSLLQKSGISTIPGVSGWPEGSVASVKNTCPEMFYQKLVQLPLALSQLQSLSSRKMLEKLESLVPRMRINKLQSIFWLKTANRKQPTPTPGCLLLSKKDITVLSSKTKLGDTLAVCHHFNLLEIKKVQISLAGQHVRLIDCIEDTILVIFTHSKELTQEFCKTLLKVVSPERFSEGTEDHPLLSDDLMVLSLDWTSTVPDIVLDNGLHITSRFKRVLADLLYIIHGNMDGPGKPSLANICPLLYTSVKVQNSTSMHQDAIFQFLLTDTHVALLREDGIFHPVPRGSSLVPAQPQFQGLEVRRRSDIRCLLVRQSDSCLVVDMTFTTQKPQTRKKLEFRRGSADVASVSRSSSQSWKLSFGCTSEAAILINHLCT
ncbi:uncharacterized protein LOC121941571 [Plectropomus leopardus]|uniref:uncharacterized protein LOC121941571 n=1 Tax=Plectropomus leopardus TaxID=160734 RepID=UPI001C4B3DC9|nr:uncharacterized protein LOC121941571 [Plectropomus leopardus]